MDSHRKLLLANKAWVQERLSMRSDYFSSMANEQRPEYMWIGCSDSRVPAEEVTGTEPGEIFVHRNIANLVVHTDFNMLSVLQFAVEVLEVKHVIVCGHYNCGGIRNAMGNKHFGLINKWLRNIKDTYRIHAPELETITDQNARFDRLVELNVTEQVQHLAETSIIQRSWNKYKRPYLHGWVYDIRTGYIKDLSLLTPETKLDNIYRFDFSSDNTTPFSEEADHE